MKFLNRLKKKKEQKEEVIEQIKNTVSNGITLSKIFIFMLLILLNNIILILSLMLCLFIAKGLF